MTPQIDHLGKMSTVPSVSTHIYGVSQVDIWENIHFSTKPRHVTPSNRLSWKNKPCSEGYNTHIYGVSQENIDGKTFIFRGNLGM